MLSKLSYRAACLAALFFILSCGGGDDDGRRLGELIVGTWQRGWGDGDVVIEGQTDLKPENLAYDLFVFRGDDSYNGMVRKGTYTVTDTNGTIVFEGTYQCDNHNLKLTSSDGTILAQVVSFAEDVIWLSYASDDYGVTVRLVLRKQP